MSFTQFNLGASIEKAIFACGYTGPTPIQSQSIPKILNGNDIIACAQTGTGKTAAFVLPALYRLSQPKRSKKPRVLILAPTRELASQIIEATARYGKFLNFNTVSIVGGMSYRQQLKKLSRAVDLIVATPGRLLDHMKNDRLDLSEIEMFILDEADRMLDMGFIDDVKAIADVTPKKKQTLLFSATVNVKLDHVFKYFLTGPIYVDLSDKKIAPILIKQELYLADDPGHKIRLLQHFLENKKMFKAIIFSSTKMGAEHLAGQLVKNGYIAASLHGDLKQSVRNKVIESFRQNKIQYLVATDIAARGIDISDVTHVINYDLPHFYEDYVHRIGRTGRAGQAGTAISFALPHDRRHVQRIERYIGQSLERKKIEGIDFSTKDTKKNVLHAFNDRPKKGHRGRPGPSGALKKSKKAITKKRRKYSNAKKD